MSLPSPDVSLIAFSSRTCGEVLFCDDCWQGGTAWFIIRHSNEKHSPHRLAAKFGKFKTPMLIIQNDLDFRVPVSEGHQLFTTLQRQGGAVAVHQLPG